LNPLGGIILVFVIAIWLTLANNHQNITPMVSGVVDISDPNHPTEIYYGNPTFGSLDEMLTDLGIRIYKEDKVQVFPDPSLHLGSQITINRALPVEVTDAKTLKVYRTWQETVGDLLKENNIELIGQDSVEPTLDAKLAQNIKIKITRVAEVEVTETESIDYKTIKKTDIDLEKGQTRVETKGVDGERKVTYLIKRVDGEEVSRTKKSSEVLKDPVNEVLIIGIGPKYTTLEPYKDTINDAARRYLINGTALRCLMIKESTGHADSIGYVNDEPTYYGLFQYTTGFWADASASAGYGGSDWSNATAQIYTTAWALAHGYGGRWRPWGSCSNQ